MSRKPAVRFRRRSWSVVGTTVVALFGVALPGLAFPGPEGAPAPISPNREIQSLFNLGSTYTDRKEYQSAEIAYGQILQNGTATPEERRRALLTLARLFQTTDANTRAAACYEKYLKEFPDDGNAPRVYLELGRTLRALGAYQLALARFYSVINTTLRLSEDGADHYRTLAKTAQYEIAETYYVEGNYEEAGRYFARIQLLDLAPADRARAAFKTAAAHVRAKDFAGAEKALRTFLDQYPDDANAPEARYLLSVTLRRLHRSDEALTVVLDLLRQESGRKQADPRRWAYWQRRTGNQLANDFYEDGAYWSALTVYEALTELSTGDPAWRLPALYQAGLCYERLGQYPHAKTDYEAVVAGCGSAPAA